MQTRVMVAEQTNSNRYWPAAPSSPWEIELTLRLRVPEEEGTDIGINHRFSLAVPSRWEEEIYDRLNNGVHGGLASVEAPLPHGGIGVDITHLLISPALTADSAAADIGRLGDTLEALAAATVAALWTGLLRLGAPDSREVA